MLSYLISVRGERHTEYAYELRAKLAGGRDVLLATTALDEAHARALEATLETALGIADEEQP